MSYKTLELKIAGPVATLTFSRQETLNSISIEFMEDLGTAIDAIGSNESVNALILTGSGRGFCSGLDLDLFNQIGNSIPRSKVRQLIEKWQGVFNRLEELPCVTIASINGVCLGGGLEMILACDFRIASTRAVFGMPEVKLGIVPDLGGITRLVRTVGTGAAKEVILRGRNFSAMEALRMGLVHRVSEHGDLKGIVENWASQFTEMPQSSVKAAKRLINLVYDADLAHGLADSAQAQFELFELGDYHGALNARADRIKSGAD